MASSGGLLSEDEVQRLLTADDQMRKERWEAFLVEKAAQGDEELRATVYSYDPPHERGRWLRIEGKVRATMAQMKDILDDRLLERQKEWHHLFIEGQILQREGPVELCWMAYDSDSFLVTDRDFVYFKIAASTETTLQLTYRTLSPQQEADLLPRFPLPSTDHAYVRGYFEAAHFVEDCGDGTLTYVYLQRADPKGMIPLALTYTPQAKILLREIKGLRHATSSSS